MPYSPPDKATFTALFPAFVAVSDEAYAFWSARAGRLVDQFATDLGEDADLAAMLATAHSLTEQGIGAGAEAEMAAQGASGFKSIRSGSLSLERAEGSGSASSGAWGATSYGQRFWAMIAPLVAGPRVSGTGVAPGYGFNGYAGPLPPWGY